MVKTLPSNVSDVGLISGGGTKIPHARWYGQKKKKVNTQNSRRNFIVIKESSIILHIIMT